MPTPLDLLIDHFGATRNFRHSHTLQLTGGALTIWWGPWVSDEFDFVYHDLSDEEYRSGRMRAERLKRTFWRKAQHESGERMFTASDLILLGTKVDPAQIATVASLMMADLDADQAAGGEGDGTGK